MFLVGGNDALDGRVADDIALGELDDGDAFNGAQGLLRFNEAGFLIWRQIDLSDVAGDNSFAAVAETGEEHEHLLGGRVLGFVETYESVIERAPAHVGQRSDFN